MDYQSELDKQKAADQFWHTRRGIFWDKGIFGLLVAAVTALGLFVVYSTVERHRETDTRQLEKEKLDAAHQQFLMNKRLEALDAVAKAMSAVSRVYFDYTKEKKNALKEEAEKAYSEALANAQIAIDRAEILFPPGFDGDLERYYQVHKKISQIGVQKCDRYRDFLFSLSRQFDRICYMALVTRESADFQKKLAQPQMTLAKIPPEERDRMTDEAYLDKHHVYWKEHRNEAIDPLPFHPGR